MAFHRFVLSVLFRISLSCLVCVFLSVRLVLFYLILFPSCRILSCLSCLAYLIPYSFRLVSSSIILSHRVSSRFMASRFVSSCRAPLCSVPPCLLGVCFLSYLDFVSFVMSSQVVLYCITSHHLRQAVVSNTYTKHIECKSSLNLMI